MFTTCPPGFTEHTRLLHTRRLCTLISCPLFCTLASSTSSSPACSSAHSSTQQFICTLLHAHLLHSLLHTRLLCTLISCMFICTLVYSAHSSALSFTLISCTPFCTLASSARSSPAHSSPTGRRPQNPRSVLSTGQEGKAGDSGPAAVAGPGPLLSLHRAGASRVDGQ